MVGILSIPFSKSLFCIPVLFFSFFLTLFSVQLGIITQEIELDRVTTNNALKINAVLDCLLAKGVLFENDILLQADLIKDKHCHDFEPVPKERMLFAGITGASLFELLNQATVNDSIAFTLLRNEQIISVAFPLAIIMPENPILVLNTPMHHSEIRDIAVNKKKKMLVSVSYDKTMKIWNSEDLTLIKTLRFPSENGNPCKIVSTAISHQGDQIACCVWGSDWETGDLIFIVDTENFSIRHVIRNLENTAFDLEFSSDDRYLLAALGDCRDIMLFDTTDYHLIAQSESSSMGANSAVFLEDNDQILCVGNDSSLRLYLLEDQHLTFIQEKKYNLINPEPFRVAYSKANGLIALGFLNGVYLELLEGTTLEPVYKPYVTEEMTRSQSLLHTLAFSDDGQLIQIPFHFDDGTYFYNTQAAELIQGERVQRGLMPPLTTSTVIRIENWQYSDTPRCNGTPLILEDGEVSRCIAINPLETGFALGTDWHLYYYDQEGLLQWKNQTQSVVKALNIIKNGELLMAAMGSGIIDFFRIADGVKLASLCVTKDRQWAFWTDEYILKYPDTPGGIGLTQLIKGLESLQAAQTTLILDACNSGAAVDYLVKNFVQKSLHNQTQERPFNVITSSKQWEKSAEIKSLGHGLFTHSLLHAIRESATLDWGQIANALFKQMRIDSQHLLGQIQFPGIYLSC